MIEPTCTIPHNSFGNYGQCGACIQIRLRKLVDNHKGAVLGDMTSNATFDFEQALLDYIIAELSREVDAVKNGTR